MQNQFFYTRREASKQQDVPKGSFDEVYVDYKDSFNISLVIRSRQLENGTTLVLLNDLHERSENVPDINPKTNKIQGFKRERNVFQSEIYLSKEDGERFYSLTSI